MDGGRGPGGASKELCGGKLKNAENKCLCRPQCCCVGE